MALFGGSPEDKDLETGIEEFLGIFKRADKTVRNQLIKIFYKEFLNQHKRFQSVAASVSRENIKRLLPSEYSEGLLAEFYDAELKDFKQQDSKKKAELLGKTLGIFLAFLEYFIASINPDVQQFIQENQMQILTQFYSMIDKIKALDISVRHKFIAARVRKIARDKTGKLTNAQQRLIAQIAARF